MTHGMALAATFELLESFVYVQKTEVSSGSNVTNSLNIPNVFAIRKLQAQFMSFRCGDRKDGFQSSRNNCGK